MSEQIIQVIPNIGGWRWATRDSVTSTKPLLYIEPVVAFVLVEGEHERFIAPVLANSLAAGFSTIPSDDRGVLVGSNQDPIKIWQEEFSDEEPLGFVDRASVELVKDEMVCPEGGKPKMDTFGFWFDERVDVGVVGAFTSYVDVSENYEVWCADKDLNPLTKLEFSIRMARAGIDSGRKCVGGKPVRGWHGATLISEALQG